MQLLPPRPLRLKSSFVWKYQLGGLALLLAGLASGAGYAWWQYGTVADLLRQSRVWAQGLSAHRVAVEGKVRTRKGVFHEYDLTVSYHDQRGAAHKWKLEFDTLVGEADQKAEPVVHYLAADPDQFALSWAVDAKASRWASIAFLGLAGVGLIGGSFSFLGITALRRLADARRCAARSDEILVTVTAVKEEVVKGRQTGNLYHFAGQTIDGRAVTGKTSFPLDHPPLFADAAGTVMVALVPQENLQRAVVMRDDFHPFVLTPEEQDRVRAVFKPPAALPAQRRV